MPIYENRANCENKVNLSAAMSAEITCGAQVFGKIAEALVNSNTSVLLCDGWYGVDYAAIAARLSEALAAKGRKCVTVSASGFFKPFAELMEQKHPWITDEPAFGRVNAGETLADYTSAANVEKVKAAIAAEVQSGNTVIVTGPGAAFAGEGMLIYFDHTADPMLWKMWTGTLIPFDSAEPRKDYFWKEYYYCDFYIMQRHKEEIIDGAAFYAEAIKTDEIKMLSQACYKEILAQLAAQPLKQIRTYSPGPWGAYRYRDLWDIPGLRNNAWNRLAGADLALLVKAGEVEFDMPIVNLLKDHGDALVGAFSNANYPGLIPVEIWLDDGYFPDRQPAERTSMPIHNHPGTEYVKRHFNEPLGRYETYYIVEAYEGANTHMGFREDACLEEWEKLCRESWAEQKPIPNWQEYIANWETNVGDLFLIPEGTTHGHGGYQMVLEMDTCGNAAGGEYSFFGYDFMRPTWDDVNGTMTGKPMKMHLDRYFNIDKGCRASYVRDNLKPRAKVVSWNKEYSMDRFATLPQMPFEIERIHFNERGEYTTGGKYLQALTLTVGKQVTIRSKSDPSKQTVIDRLQCALVPAGFGDYEIISSTPGPNTVVLWRLKQG